MQFIELSDCLTRILDEQMLAFFIVKPLGKMEKFSGLSIFDIIKMCLKLPVEIAWEMWEIIEDSHKILSFVKFFGKFISIFCSKFSDDSSKNLLFSNRKHAGSWSKKLEKIKISTND
jgi:hypothetical protein